MFSLQKTAPSVADFGVLMNTAEAVALQGGKLKPAPVRRGKAHRTACLPPAEINQTTREAFQASLEIYLGQEGTAHALALGGAGTDSSEPLMGLEIRRVLEAAHRIKKFNDEIAQLKKIYFEHLIARNAEDSKIVLRALDDGIGRDQMQLSGAAQARVDEAKRNLDVRCAELNGYLQGERAPASAH